LIYAAPRCEIKELQTVRQLLVEKFGKDFALSAIETPDGQVSERVLKKLRVEPPEERLVTLYLKEIARTYNISYGATPPTTPPPCDHDEDDNPSTKMAQMEERIAIIDSNTEELSKASPPKNLRSPINVAPPSPSTDNLHPVIRLPDTANMATVAKPPIVTQTVLKYRLSDDDELARRFAALKRP
jgi:vacuolar protein sorting-associated protein IST1